jgi:hypothetical protein
MLGARYGFDCIPYRLTSELNKGSDLDARVYKLIKLINNIPKMILEDLDH